MLRQPSRRVLAVAALAVVAAMAAGTVARMHRRPPAQAHGIPTALALRSGYPVEASVAPGGLSVYALDLPSGRLLHLTVDQQGVDVVLTLRSPAGEARLEVDSPNRAWGPEELWWIAGEAGRWRLEVRPLGRMAAGRYSLRMEVRAPEPKDRLRLAAQRRVARKGLADLAVARGLWRRAGEPRQAAFATLWQAEVARAAGDASAAGNFYRQALAAFHALGDDRQEIYVGQRLGDLLRLAGDFAGAWRAQEAALALATRRGFADEQARALNNFAAILEAKGEIRAAIDGYRRALAAFRRLGEQETIATLLHNLGVCSIRLGLLPDAESALGEAAVLREALGDVPGLGGTLTELGWVYRLRALPTKNAALRERARATLERALARRREARDELGEAGTLDRLGTLLRDSGPGDAALDCYRRSLALLLFHHPVPREIAHGLSNQAGLWLERRDFAHARLLASHALGRFAELPATDPEGEAHAHYLLGRAAAGLDDPALAREELERALDRFEALRASLGDETLTVPFFALRQIYFEGAIGSLMDLHTRRPGQGFAAQALLTAERGHMRTLIDGIVERQRRERGAAREAAPDLSLARIEGELLDGETLLLEYAVGETRSYLWTVGSGGLTPHALPGRRELEPLARQAYNGFSDPRRKLEPPVRLAQWLLPALLARPGIRRLAIVADGPLAYVPFAALPWGPAGKPLAESFEIVRLPSATTLLALRRRHAAAPVSAAARGIPVAVLADPVFTADDPRVQGAPTRPATPLPEDRADLDRAVHDLQLRGLERLFASRREAEAIAALAPGSRVELDFAAAREALESVAVRHARILHLATHGLVSAADPAATGIVLSLVDDHGHPRQGFLRAGEIAGLDLRADLVVLSSCKSAMGPGVRGEGLMGLSRAFLHAGARQVVASLWNVDDKATATLMTHFYTAILHDHLAPAAALRRAQLAVRADPRTAAPYYWAGFELQGDWR